MVENITDKLGDNTPDVVYGNSLYVDMCVYTVINTDHTGLEGGMSMAHPATLVRSDVIKSHKFDTSFKIAADYNMMLDLYASGEFMKLDMTISQF